MASNVEDANQSVAATDLQNIEPDTAARNLVLNARLSNVAKRHSGLFTKSSDSINSSTKSETSDDNEPLGRVKQRVSNANLNVPPSLQRSTSNDSIKGKSVLTEMDPNCICSKVIQNSDPRRCKTCRGNFPSVVKIYQEKKDLSNELQDVNKTLEDLSLRFERSMIDMVKLKKKLADTEDDLEVKTMEYDRLKGDLESLGEKLLREIKKRESLQDSAQEVKDEVAREIEELTEKLFTEANTLVAQESRQRAGAEEQMKLTEKQLNDTKAHLQMEQTHLRELRLRYAKLEEEHEQLALKISETQKEKELEQPQADVSVEAEDANLIDPFLFDQFKEMVDEAPRIKASKFHNLLYMRNAMEDDVIPCLRFGGNPRTSTKKFIDAIMANNCFIEEMNEETLSLLVERDKKLIAAAEEKKEEPPTPSASIFNKTVFERLTNVLTPSSNTFEQTPGGCSTCGRDEPYRYQFKISDVQQDIWFPICVNCRDRLVAVCDFYQLVRNIRQGLYSSRKQEDLYLEALNIKRTMFYKRTVATGCSHPDLALNKCMPVRTNSSAILPLNELGSGNLFTPILTAPAPKKKKSALPQT
ncbi:hypothetical protein BC833DRAFT_648525 [Globomyces pollinis-pini]|nr:hypothetical protein BC833DRAFT_648525 [Globomyces pollinis-pini]KAJ3000896.1 hypothetical protein HDV02_002359 [Globomyces sp. JEL0801]